MHKLWQKQLRQITTLTKPPHHNTSNVKQVRKKKIKKNQSSLELSMIVTVLSEGEYDGILSDVICKS